MRRFGVVFFDVDSTLVTIEGIDVLARGNAEIAQLTNDAMNGKIALEDVYRRRLEIVRPSLASIEALGHLYVESLVSDARDVIATLRKDGVDVHLVTAGIHQAIAILATELSIPERAVHAVPLSFDADGEYSGFDDRNPLTRRGGKETVVLNARSRIKGAAMFVGDGVSDLETMNAVDLFVGFGGVAVREDVRAAAPIFLTQPALSPILEIVRRGI